MTNEERIDSVLRALDGAATMPASGRPPATIMAIIDAVRELAVAVQDQESRLREAEQKASMPGWMS